MNTGLPCEALQEGKRLELTYDGYERIVEVHAVGYTANKNLVMRVYQTSGGSNSGNPLGWKLMTIHKAASISMSDEDSEAPRQGYRQGDKAMAEIICEI